MRFYETFLSFTVSTLFCGTVLHDINKIRQYTRWILLIREFYDIFFLILAVIAFNKFSNIINHGVT